MPLLDAHVGPLICVHVPLGMQQAPGEGQLADWHTLPSPRYVPPWAAHPDALLIVQFSVGRQHAPEGQFALAHVVPTPWNAPFWAAQLLASVRAHRPLVRQHPPVGSGITEITRGPVTAPDVL